VYFPLTLMSMHSSNANDGQLHMALPACGTGCCLSVDQSRGLPKNLGSCSATVLCSSHCITDKLMGHAIETIMMAVNSGAAPTSRSLGVKFLFIAWAIFSVIMLSAYTGEHSTMHVLNGSTTQLSSITILSVFSMFHLQRYRDPVKVH
jgi:hypothetical protein